MRYVRRLRAGMPAAPVVRLMAVARHTSVRRRLGGRHGLAGPGGRVPLDGRGLLHSRRIRLCFQRPLVFEVLDEPGVVHVPLGVRFAPKHNFVHHRVAQLKPQRVDGLLKLLRMDYKSTIGRNLSKGYIKW